MQETQNAQEAVEDSETDFQSFYEAQEEFEKEVQHGNTGFARLQECEVVDKSEVPEEYTNKFGGLSENYLLFRADLGNTNKTVTVVCPARDGGVNLETAFSMTGATSIEDLSGRKVPIQHVENDIYRIELFKSTAGSEIDLGPIPVPAIRYLIDRNFLQFKGGKWQSKGPFEPLMLVSILAMIPIFGTLFIGMFIGGMFAPVASIVAVFAYLFGIEYYGR